MFAISVDESIKMKLLLRNDKQEFYDLIEKNRSHLDYFMPRIRENTSIKDTEKVIELFLKQLVENNGFRTGVLYNDKLIGVTGLKYIDWLNFKAEIMYWIDKDYTGRGITTRCVKKVIEIAFGELKLNKVVIKSSKKNRASIKVAEKCGFVLEGTCRSDELLADGYTDVNLYGLTRDDYESFQE